MAEFLGYKSAGTYIAAQAYDPIKKRLAKALGITI